MEGVARGGERGRRPREGHGHEALRLVWAQRRELRVPPPEGLLHLRARAEGLPLRLAEEEHAVERAVRVRLAQHEAPLPVWLEDMEPAAPPVRVNALGRRRGRRGEGLGSEAHARWDLGDSERPLVLQDGPHARADAVRGHQEVVSERGAVSVSHGLRREVEIVYLP